MQEKQYYKDFKSTLFWSWLTDSLYYEDSNSKEISLVTKQDLNKKITELSRKGDYISVRQLLSLVETHDTTFLAENTSRSFRINTTMYFKLINLGLNNEITLSKIVASIVAKRAKNILQELADNEKIIQDRLEMVGQIFTNWIDKLFSTSKKYSRENYYISCKWPISTEMKRKLSRLVYYSYGSKFLSRFSELGERRQNDLLKVWWDQYENVSVNNDDEFFDLHLFFNEIPDKMALYCDFWINYYYCVVPFVTSLEKVLPSPILKELTESFINAKGKYFTNKNGKKSVFLLVYGSRDSPSLPVSIDEHDFAVNLDTVQIEAYQDVNFPIEETLSDFILDLTREGNLIINKKYSLEDSESILKVNREESTLDLKELERMLQENLENQNFKKARKISDQLVFHSLREDVVSWLQINFNNLVNSSQVVSVRMPKCIDFLIQTFRDQFDLTKMISEIIEYEFNGK